MCEPIELFKWNDFFCDKLPSERDKTNNIIMFLKQIFRTYPMKKCFCEIKTSSESPKLHHLHHVINSYRSLFEHSSSSVS